MSHCGDSGGPVGPGVGCPGALHWGPWGPAPEALGPMGALGSDAFSMHFRCNFDQKCIELINKSIKKSTIKTKKQNKYKKT